MEGHALTAGYPGFSQIKLLHRFLAELFHSFTMGSGSPNTGLHLFRQSSSTGETVRETLLFPQNSGRQEGQILWQKQAWDSLFPKGSRSSSSFTNSMENVGYRHGDIYMDPFLHIASPSACIPADPPAEIPSTSFPPGERPRRHFVAAVLGEKMPDSGHFLIHDRPPGGNAAAFTPLSPWSARIMAYSIFPYSACSRAPARLLHGSQEGRLPAPDPMHEPVLSSTERTACFT